MKAHFTTLLMIALIASQAWSLTKNSNQSFLGKPEDDGDLCDDVCEDMDWCEEKCKGCKEDEGKCPEECMECLPCHCCECEVRKILRRL